MPRSSGCRPPQNQMRDVLLLVSLPLEDRGELVAKVCIGVQQRVKKHRHGVLRPAFQTFAQIFQVLRKEQTVLTRFEGLN